MDKNQFHTARGYQILEKNKKLLTASMEDYLEMIYRFCKVQGYVRIKTLAETLNVRDSSVTKMVQKIASLGLLEYKKYGIITLTQDGKELGAFLLQRHKTVEIFLKFISNGDYILKDVELIEHSFNPKLITNLEILTQFFEEHPEITDKYIKFKNNHLS
ncbi:DtxR family transcriptional regulator [Alkalicella caledoniensis]|uniref:Manganese transport regulator n=1 Tax=Alkalicella caledoniensis TaxID=2731377 RepID=A0A7G9W4Q1_ALKCA|nr:iron dependent repressor, metal binding and dimerization domain protein [Alkalicella caledoniensis]QNO13663.1 DtxR family transcriptional regulator [Alkalicella caledoniensis]